MPAAPPADRWRKVFANKVRPALRPSRCASAATAFAAPLRKLRSDGLGRAARLDLAAPRRERGPRGDDALLAWLAQLTWRERATRGSSASSGPTPPRSLQLLPRRPRAVQLGLAPIA